MTLGTSVLSIVAIPGLDPLCLLIFATYPLAPVHKSINFLRTKTEHTAHRIFQTLSLDKLLDTWLGRKEDALNFLRYSENRAVTFEQREDEIRITLQEFHSGEEVITLEIAKEASNNPPHLEKIVINKVYLQELPPGKVKNIFKSFARLFPWNPKTRRYRIRQNPIRRKVGKPQPGILYRHHHF